MSMLVTRMSTAAAAGLLVLAAPLAAAQTATDAPSSNRTPPRLQSLYLGDAVLDRRKGEQLLVRMDKAKVPADAQSTAILDVEVRDVNGALLTRDVRISVETTLGRVLTPDTENTRQQTGFVVDGDRQEPGVQLTTKAGCLQIVIAAPDAPGRAEIIVSSGNVDYETHVDFVAELRPLLVVGLLDGILRASRTRADTQAPVRTNDGLEDELSEIGVSRSGSELYQAQGRGAAFAKGEVGGGYLLTMAYDSDKDRTRFFRDIQPDQFYPIYGDASQRGFDAQTTRRGYLRLDKDRSYFLFGDYNTENENVEARSLGAYNRTLTGGRHHLQNDRLTTNVFAARDSLRRVIDEQPGRGISGPYQLRTSNGVVNSEQVELITRDRDQPAVILNMERLARFTDYEFEPFSGQLLFRRPIPTVDSNLNPVSIRVTYEVEEGGPDFWVGGANAQWRAAKWLEIGAGYARDEDPNTPYELLSGNATIRFGENTRWLIEGARSTRDAALAQIGSEGDGWRSEFLHRGSRVDARVFWGRTNPEFDNPTAQLTQGRRELGADVTWRIGERTNISFEALQTEDALIGADRTGASITLGRELANEKVHWDVGLRYGRDEVNPAAAAGARPNYSSVYNFTPNGSFTGGAFSNGAFANGPLTENEFTTAHGRLTAALADKWTGYIEGDVALDDQGQGREAWGAAAGLDYQFHDRARAYLRHEQAQSLSGLYGLGTGEEHSATLFGLDSAYREDGQLFSEYRMRDAISGRDAEAALGLRQLWRVREGLALSGSLERLEALSGASQEATAATFGVEFTQRERQKASARLEWREDPFATSWLSTFAWTAKLSRDWSVLFRNLYNRVENDDQSLGRRTQDRAILGFAYRDTDTNIWNSLIRYEFKDENDNAALAPLERQAHIVSLHANYKPTRALTLSGQIAGKWLDETIADSLGRIENRFGAQLVAGRALYDLTDRWDLGINASVLRSDDGAEQYGFGVEVGRVLIDNLWLSLGYNLVGFSDDDLIDADYSRRGVYLRIRFKFDEKLFAGRDSRHNKVLEPRAAQP